MSFALESEGKAAERWEGLEPGPSLEAAFFYAESGCGVSRPTPRDPCVRMARTAPASESSWKCYIRATERRPQNRVSFRIGAMPPEGGSLPGPSAATCIIAQGRDRKKAHTARELNPGRGLCGRWPVPHEVNKPARGRPDTGALNPGRNRPRGSIPVYSKPAGGHGIDYTTTRGREYPRARLAETCQAPDGWGRRGPLASREKGVGACTDAATLKSLERPARAVLDYSVRYAVSHDSMHAEWRARCGSWRVWPTSAPCVCKRPPHPKS